MRRNAGGSGRIRGNAREDGPINTVRDLVKTANPELRNRMAGIALASGTGIGDEMATNIVDAIASLLTSGESDVDVRRRLNPDPRFHRVGDVSELDSLLEDTYGYA